jgi:hypothetical protein
MTDVMSGLCNFAQETYTDAMEQRLTDYIVTGRAAGAQMSRIKQCTPPLHMMIDLHQ